MNQIWIGTVELSYKEGSVDSFQTAFTNFVTWADSSDGFAKKVRSVRADYGWKLLSVERAGPFDPRFTYQREIEDILERVRTNSGACIYATFHTYPAS